ncbi:MAG: hypothetical protein ACTSX9_09535 [Candidatus Njordarchaeales archaeon]
MSFDDLERLSRRIGVSKESLKRYIFSLIRNNPFIISEIRALDFCEKFFRKRFLRTNFFETPDLVSSDGDIWVEVKDLRGLAPGTSTLSLAQLSRLIKGIKEGKNVFLAIVSDEKVYLLRLNELNLNHSGWDVKKNYLKVLSALNKLVEEKILRDMMEKSSSPK